MSTPNEQVMQAQCGNCPNCGGVCEVMPVPGDMVAVECMVGGCGYSAYPARFEADAISEHEMECTYHSRQEEAT